MWPNLSWKVWWQEPKAHVASTTRKRAEWPCPMIPLTRLHLRKALQTSKQHPQLGTKFANTHVYREHFVFDSQH